MWNSFVAFFVGLVACTLIAIAGYLSEQVFNAAGLTLGLVLLSGFVGAFIAAHREPTWKMSVGLLIALPASALLPALQLCVRSLTGLETTRVSGLERALFEAAMNFQFMILCCGLGAAFACLYWHFSREGVPVDPK